MSEHESVDLDTLDLDGVRKYRAHLVDDIKDIDYQLSTKDVQRDGRRLTGREYHEWRAKATGAKRYKEKELRACNARLHTLSEESNQGREGRKDRALLANMASTIFSGIEDVSPNRAVAWAEEILKAVDSRS